MFRRPKFLAQRHRNCLILCWSILLLAAHLCWGQSTDGVRVSASTSLDSFSHRIWQARDGLLQSAVQSLAKGADGYLWIGTSSGLVRFDGSRFVVFNHQSSPAFIDDSVWSLATGRNRTVWIGTEGGGLIRLRNGVFVPYARRSGLNNLFIRAVLEDSQGTLWVGTDNGVFRMQGDTFLRVDDTAEIPAMSVYTIYQGPDGTVYVGGSRLLVIGIHGKHSYGSTGSRADRLIGAVRQTRDGALWVGTFAHLRSSNQPTQDPFRVGHELSLGNPAHGSFTGGASPAGNHLHVSALSDAPDGSLWIGTYGDGLLRYKAGQLRWFRSPEYLIDNNINAILVDAGGSIWVGTQNGLVLLKPTEASTISTDFDSPTNISTVLAYRSGSMLLTTLGGALLQSLPNRLIPGPAIPGMEGVSVRTTFRDARGVLWLGSSGQGVYAWDGRHLRHFRELDFVRAFAESPQGQLWVGTDGGLWSSSDGRFAFTPGLDDRNSVRALQFDRQGQLWMGTDTGIARLRDGVVQPSDPRLKPLRSVKVWSLLVDSAGNVWIGTRGSGLFLWDGVGLHRYSTAMGLPSDSVFAIVEDAQGQMWFSGPDRIWSVDRRAMIEAAKGPRFAPTMRSFGVSEGVTTAQINGGVQPAGALSGDGDVWFAGSNGAIRVHPGRSLPPITAQAMIEDLSVDGQQLRLRSAMHIPANTQQVEIRYTAVQLTSPEEMRFRYRLEGLEDRWTEAGERRVAIYTHVPPGHYSFRVLAYDLETPDKTTEASLELSFEPYFYETRWFYALCACAALASIVLGVFLHRRHLHQQFRAVLAERSRVAREMHDTVIQGCVGVSTLLEAAASTETSFPEKSHSLVARARAQVKVTVDEAREAVWKLRHEDEKTTSAFGSAVTAMAREMSSSAEVPIVFESLGPLPSMDVAASHSLLLLIREAIANSLRHASPRKILISVEAKSKSLHVTIADDGLGFRMLTDKHFHYGLVGMRERVEELDGHFDVLSSPGTGTTIQVKVPLRCIVPKEVAKGTPT